jgi:hypothetical protein
MKDVTPMTQTKTLTYAQQLDANIRILRDGLGMTHDQAYSRALDCTGPVVLTDRESDQVAIRLLMKDGKSLDEATSILMKDRETTLRQRLAGGSR